MSEITDPAYPAKLAALDRSIAGASEELAGLTASMGQALATGKDRSAVIAAMALSIYESMDHFGAKAIAKILAVAIARLADRDDLDRGAR